MEDSELYELIFCSQYGAENRKKLLRIYKDRLPGLKNQHEKDGVKINGKAIDLEWEIGKEDN